MSTLVLLIGGIGAGVQGQWFDQGWIWLSLGLLVGVGVLMFPMARRPFPPGPDDSRVDGDRDCRFPGRLRPSGRSGGESPHGTGVRAAILLILYLMVLKPF